jgi:glycosyltransferase involved in cell wall biosynthesis
MLISVITPTYNRAHTLGDACDSLRGQHVFLEWIVVDDGSTDDSARVTGELARDSPFPVSYSRQDHVGKWAAVNRGVAAAKGDMVALLDSDDRLTPGALECLIGHWAAIPDKTRYVGVTGLCADEMGRIIGDRFPADITDATWQDMHYRYRVTGEKWGIQRTDTLRDHPFPPSQGFESVVWCSIGRHYQTRYVNDVVRIYRTSGTDQLSRMPFPMKAAGAARAYSALLNEDTRWFRHAPDTFIKYAAQYARAMLHRRVPVRQHIAGLHTWQARAFWAAALPLGWLLFRRDLRGEVRAQP